MGTADPNCASAAGWTPLILCAMADRADACRLLINARADVFRAGPRGRTALFWAEWYKANAALAVLKEEGRKAKRDDREGLKRLQTADADETAAKIVKPLGAEALSVA